MSDAVPEYHPGDQNISEQLSTFSLFGRMIKWGSLTIAVLLVMLVLWFCVSAGFFAGLGVGVVLTAVGVFFLRSKPAPSH
jgi:thiamine transporter ThiT